MGGSAANDKQMKRMKERKKKTGLSRLFEIAGQKKGLLVLAGILSAGSAVCMLVADGLACGSL